MENKDPLKELFVLKEISEILNEGTELDGMLQKVLSKLLAAAGFASGWIFFIDENGKYELMAAEQLPPALSIHNFSPMCDGTCWCIDKFRTKKLNRASNIMECKRLEQAYLRGEADTCGLTHHASVPLRSGEEFFGLLNIASPSRSHFKAEELALLESVAYQIGNSIQRIRLHEREKVHAVKEERSRLARDLHDSVNQLLFSAALMAKTGAGIKEGTAKKDLFTQIAGIIEQAQAEMKALIWQLRPSGLEQGILPALQAYCETLGLDAAAEITGISVLPSHIEEMLWKIAQEACNNCRKHSGSKQVRILISIQKDRVKMTVEDFGKGFLPDCLIASNVRTLGLTSMRERAESAGGTLSISSKLNAGTIITADLPF